MKEKTVKKRKLKRLLSVVLSLVMVITLIQVNRMTVYAWDVSNTKLSDFVYEGTNISSLRVQLLNGQLVIVMLEFSVQNLILQGI